jgi:hypothetical protein
MTRDDEIAALRTGLTRIANASMAEGNYSVEGLRTLARHTLSTPAATEAERESHERECASLREALRTIERGVVKPPLTSEQAQQMMQWQDAARAALKEPK